MKRVPIGDCVSSIKKWNPVKDAADQCFNYIDIASVSQTEKQITDSSKLLGSEAPSRARQLVAAGDVLVSTVRPNLNAVAPVPDLYHGATASTGFAVLRPIKERLEGRYLYHWVRTPDFVTLMAKQATGQSYPAVSEKIVKESEIPLPPLEEQRRIAGILDQADALRRLRHRTLTHLNTLAQSIFHEMFGDPATNPKGWPIGTIDGIAASTQYGTSSKAGSVGEYPILRMGNLTTEGSIALDNLKYIDLNSNEIQKYTVHHGDILFNRTNSPELVGKTAVYKGEKPLAFAGYLVRLRTNNHANPDYVSAVLNSPYGKATLRGMCKSIIGMANINAKELRTIKLPLPPMDRQTEFSHRLQDIEEMAVPRAEAISASEELFTSLQHRAFRGEL